MQQGKVFNNDVLAGVISKQHDGSYSFEYDTEYFLNQQLPAISLTLPKTKKEYHSKILFPFFFNLLSEGSNKKIQSQILKIDEDDYFTFLLKTTAYETIGAIRVEEIAENENN